MTDVLAKVIVTQNKAEINEDDADAYTHEKTCFKDEVCPFFMFVSVSYFTLSKRISLFDVFGYELLCCDSVLKLSAFPHL